MSDIRKVMAKFSILVLLFTFSILGYSQEVDKIPVELTHSGDDILGATLSFKLKENINNSSEYRVTYRDEPHFTIVLVTMDAMGVSKSTAFSYSFIFSNPVRNECGKMFIQSNVAIFGRERIQGGADAIIAAFDKTINETGWRNQYLIEKHYYELQKK